MISYLSTNTPTVHEQQCLRCSSLMTRCRVSDALVAGGPCLRMLTAATADIDPEITEAEREVARALIARHLPNNHTTTPHPSLTPLPTVHFSDIFRQEIDRVAAGGLRQQGIDVSRYEAADEPANEGDETAMRQALRTAYISSTFLS